MLGMAAGAGAAVCGAALDARVALEAVLPQHAADAGALVAVFAVRIGVEHPVVAV